MNFLGRLFNPKQKESLVLVDISAGSVAGAYASYEKGAEPSIHYMRRVPIEMRGDEPHEKAMLRALDLLGASLIRDGAPALARHAGSGSVGGVLVSIDAPWQETTIRTERFERTEPFTFTKRMVAKAVEETSTPAPGMFLADQSIIGTILNGYETREPYGRKVRRAAVIVLTSLVNEEISKTIISTLRGLFHTSDIFSIAGSSLRYQAMRIAFPHEHDTLILDAMGPLISVALIHKNLLVAVAERSENVSTREVGGWVEQVKGALTELAKQYPLPRTIFLLAQEQDAPVLEKALNTAELKELWLSVNPPKVIRVLGNHLSGFIRQTSPTLPDLPLLLMTLYWPHRPTD